MEDACVDETHPRQLKAYFAPSEADDKAVGEVQCCTENGPYISCVRGTETGRNGQVSARIVSKEGTCCFPHVLLIYKFMPHTRMQPLSTG